MKRIVLASLTALALAAVSSPVQAAGGPLGFTIGGAGSLSLYAAPFVGGGGAPGPGTYFPGYAGCCNRGMWPAYAYMGGYPTYQMGGYGYPGYGYPGYGDAGQDPNAQPEQFTPPAPTPGKSDDARKPAPNPSPTPVYYYPQQGYAFYSMGYPGFHPVYYGGR